MPFHKPFYSIVLAHHVNVGGLHWTHISSCNHGKAFEGLGVVSALNFAIIPREVVSRRYYRTKKMSSRQTLVEHILCNLQVCRGLW